MEPSIRLSGEQIPPRLRCSRTNQVKTIHRVFKGTKSIRWHSTNQLVLSFTAFLGNMDLPWTTILRGSLAPNAVNPRSEIQESRPRTDGRSKPAISRSRVGPQRPKTHQPILRNRLPSGIAGHQACSQTPPTPLDHSGHRLRQRRKPDSTSQDASSAHLGQLHRMGYQPLLDPKR